MKTDKLANFIRVAGEVQRTREFQCPFIPDFFMKVTYASKHILNQIREVSREVVTNLRTRGEDERLNDDRLREEYAKQIIRGWRGLTLKKLDKIIPGIEYTKENLKDIFPDEKIETEKEMLDLVSKELPYSWQIAKAIMDSSLEIETWVVTISGNVENYSAIALQKKKELENLK